MRGLGRLEATGDGLPVSPGLVNRGYTRQQIAVFFNEQVELSRGSRFIVEGQGVFRANCQFCHGLLCYPVATGWADLHDEFPIIRGVANDEGQRANLTIKFNPWADITSLKRWVDEEVSGDCLAGQVGAGVDFLFCYTGLSLEQNTKKHSKPCSLHCERVDSLPEYNECDKKNGRLLSQRKEREGI